VGFFDSFSAGLTGVGNFINEFANTPVGGRLIDRGVNELFDVIGGFDTSPPSGRGAPLGPLGSPVPGGITTLQAVAFCQGRTPRTIIPGTPWECGGMATRNQPTPSPQRGSMTFPRTDQFFEPQFRTPIPTPGAGGLRPQFSVPMPAIPSSQPFGVMPGTQPFGGSTMPAFPVATNASFPSFATTIGTPFQPASLGALIPGIARQLPGIVGGAIGGSLLEGVFGGGGGGSTPMFRPTMAGARAQTFRAQNPVTGQDVFFRPAGKPILWSADLSACKRVNKVARRARRKR